jgi:hypothetical protein
MHQNITAPSEIRRSRMIDAIESKAHQNTEKQRPTKEYKKGCPGYTLNPNCNWLRRGKAV